jgi:hypothetical protein
MNNFNNKVNTKETVCFFLELLLELLTVILFKRKIFSYLFHGHTVYIELILHK